MNGKTEFHPTRLVVGVTGASGAPIALEALRQLKAAGTHELHLVISAGGLRVASEELGERGVEALRGFADVVHEDSDIGAPIASGSFRTAGMVIVPCSMKTLAAINAGLASSLIGRAADVTLKEGRPLVLVPREAPLGTIHLRNLLSLSRMGVRIVPPVMAFYHHPQTLDDCVRQLAARIIEPFVPEPADLIRWGG
ncbi:MAG TPA: UbiX family flavin prenyltransferase [Rectinemataceae bacterium]|nr:UbiX family flavin prenyltransferase [Rectinemataceae bacterium]